MRLEAFQDREAQADAAADLLAGELARPGPRSLVVTGGSSPGPVYDRLAVADLGWDRVTVTLSDERWVDAASPDSNERLVRERLLTARAAKARLVPLKGHGATPGEDAAAAEGAVRDLSPFAGVLLGMGEDGHIGSLFPGQPGLAAALDPGGERWVVGVAMSGLAPFVPRISLTVRAMLSARVVVLLIAGAAKRALVERVFADPSFDPPAAAILRQDRAPVLILWAP